MNFQLNPVGQVNAVTGNFSPLQIHLDGRAAWIAIFPAAR